MTSALDHDSISSILERIDPIFRSALGLIRLASGEAIPVRLYEVHTQSNILLALEFDYQDTFIYNEVTHKIDIFSNLQLAHEYYDCPFIFVANQTGKPIRHKIMHYEEIGLSDVDMRVLYFISRGFMNKRIASELKCAESTIKNRLTKIFRIIRVRSREEAIVFVNDSGMLANFKPEYNNDI